MELIKDCEFSGERVLFARHNLELVNVHIGLGESPLKKCSDIIARNCIFDGKYPFWHTDRFTVENCTFNIGARSGPWYSKDCRMIDCKVEAPKLFREMDGVYVRRTDFPNGQEMFWNCRNIDLKDVRIDACDYLFMNSRNIVIEDYEQHGNYSFQYAANVRIKNAKIYSKDAFWNTENVTVENSLLDGEYLGWHSQNLTLINCHILGTQPLCYARRLKFVNCTFGDDADLAFEESEVEADIVSPVVSVKNPKTGFINAPAIGNIIIDENLPSPGDCKITITEAGQ